MNSCLLASSRIYCAVTYERTIPSVLHATIYWFQQTATEAVMQNVYQKLISPTLSDAPPDTLAGLQRVCDQPKYGFVVDSTRAASVWNNLTCDIMALPEAFIPATGTFVVGKHSPYRRLINSK
jgi:hypothetical protein